jgi:hypothetical protein
VKRVAEGAEAQPPERVAVRRIYALEEATEQA